MIVAGRGKVLCERHRRRRRRAATANSRPRPFFYG